MRLLAILIISSFIPSFFSLFLSFSIFISFFLYLFPFFFFAAGRRLEFRPRQARDATLDAWEHHLTPLSVQQVGRLQSDPDGMQLNADYHRSVKQIDWPQQCSLVSITQCDSRDPHGVLLSRIAAQGGHQGICLSCELAGHDLE